MNKYNQMPNTTISFMYKIKDDPKTYYGKSIYFISDIHNGLNEEIFPIVLASINKFRIKQKIELLEKDEIVLGVLYACPDYKNPIDWSSRNEIKCFDYYNYYNDIYINGVKLE